MHPETPALPAAKLAAGNLLTDTEVAALYGCAVQTLRNMRWRGEGPEYLRLGGRMIRYRPEAVTAYMQRKAAAA